MNSLKLTTTAAAIALLLAGCGGGGADVEDEVAAASLQLSGTAATGLALANSTVQVKCASGTGSATTDGSGTYTVTVTNGSLPCMLKVTGEADGATVTLHSVTETGTTSGNSTTAVANVTPLTEMIVAQLAGTMPSDLFDSFDANSGSQVSTAALSSAKTAVVDALRDATGIDLGDIDPFKSPLVAATPSAPTAGNQYDQLLDTLKAKVPTESLPLVVNQIAAAKSGGESSPVTLTEVMTAVDRGSLANCPAAVSGKYRVLDYWGRTAVRNVDFKNNKMTTATGEALYDIAPSTTQPCQFVASNANAEVTIVIGSAGAGGYRARNLSNGNSVTGFIFPVQGHSLSAFSGTWSYLQSGYLPGEGVLHIPGQMTVNAGGSATVCDYVPEQNWICDVEIDVSFSLNARSDGGMTVLEDGVEVARLYGYRTPSGAVNVFGTTNPDGNFAADVVQTIIVAAKLQPLSLPTVGGVTKYWDLNQVRANGVNSTSLWADATTVTAVDTVNATFSRERASDGRPDSLKINHPLSGIRHRPASVWESPNGTVNIPGTIQIPLPGLAMTLSVNDSAGTHFLATSVMRP